MKQTLFAGTSVDYVSAPPLSWIAVLLLLVCGGGLKARAQAWPDSTGPTSSTCYRVAVPPLSQVPPLHTDMSQAALMGYIYLDSIMRTSITQAQWENIDSSQSLDTLKKILKYWYAMTDYDPVLLREYERDAPYIEHGYWGKPAALEGYLESKASQILGDSSKVPYLMVCSYILHITALDVSREFDSLPPNSDDPMPRVCVEAAILDTVKGKHILTGDCQSFLPRASSVQPPCFHFSYCPGWSKNGGDKLQYGHSGDSLVFTKNALGWNAIQPGSEYIVFLTSYYLDYDGKNCYFDFAPIMGDKVGGIYPVVNGQVSDPYNYWGLGQQVSLADFENGLKQRISSIENP